MEFPNTTMVEAKAVRKRFGSLEVLKAIDFEARSGEVVAIIGPSGSGKSTFLRCINHLEAIDGGTLLVDGQYVGYRRVENRLYELPNREIARRRSQIGMVFQSWNLFSQRTVLQNIMEGPLQVKKTALADARNAAMELLELVGMSAKADAYPAMLSGGQQQRVAIARALAMKPKLMLFDEATSALDPELVGEVLNVIEQLARLGMTMVIVTHEMAFAREIANRVYFMDNGKVVESGLAHELFDSPQNERTRAFLTRYR